MSARDQDNRYCVPALERGIRILELFERQRTEISGVDVARELALPRATAFRLLRTLEQLECLTRTEGGAYRVGPAVLRLGFEYISSLEVTEVARGTIDALRDRSGCSAQLVIRDGRDVVVALRAVGPGAFSTNVRVGTRFPAHATVLGRLLLCELTEAELANLYPEPELPLVSGSKPGTLAELKALMCEDLARGYAVSESFFEQGISAVAAPVRAQDGGFIAAVSVTVYRPTLEPKAFRDRLVQQVLTAANAISADLHYRPAAGSARALAVGLDKALAARPRSRLVEETRIPRSRQ
jgi:DNA-binding IclR family transcriptional regulator